MQKIIKCTVSGEYVRGSGVVAGAAGSHDDVVLELAFKDIWESTTKTAFWWDANGENPTATILTLAMLVPGETEVYRVPIPAEAKAYEGQMKLTLRGAVLSESGVIEEQATVSADAYFDILPGSVPDEYKDAMEVTPSVAEQIQAGVDALKGEFVEAQDAERNAIDAADRAKQSEENASESERISRASKETALEAANAAETSSASANAAAVVAEKAKDDAARSAEEAVNIANKAKEYGKENAGKLLYVGEDGYAATLGVGTGLKIIDGVIIVDGIVDSSIASALGNTRLGATVLGRGASNSAIGIKSIEQTVTSTEDGGTNEITVTLTDGSTQVFYIKNGSKGDKGDDGYSPVRGVDYWTDDDIAEIKSYVDGAILGGAW